jgi:alanine racemase
MSKTRQPFVQTRRDAWVEVNLGYIEHNIKQLIGFTKPGVKFLAVVKADAYGHGATMIAPTLIASGVNMLGVASVDEGIQLRETGIVAPILVLGSAPSWSFASAVENDLQLSIFTDEHIKTCVNTFERTGKKPEVHIKIDTGMHRIGLNYKEAGEFLEKLKNVPQIIVQGIFTHLACAEISDITELQNNKFKNIIKNQDFTLAHCLNTAGSISYPDMQYGMVRVGIGIYGLMPDLIPDVQNIPTLKQCMSLKGRIIHIHELDAGSSLSYGYTYTAEKNLKVATVPIGYADGVTRSLSNKIYGLLNGKKVKQIGNITMDQMMFDITEISEARPGDVITLLGEDNEEFISIDEWAKILGTINYEITCKLRVRLPRVYTR